MNGPKWIAEARRPDELDEWKRAGVDGIVVFANPYGHPFAKGLTLTEIQELNDQAMQINLVVYVAFDRILTRNDLEPIARILKELVSIDVAGILCFDETVHLIARSRNIKIPVIYAPGTLMTNAEEADFYVAQGFKGVLAASDLAWNEMLLLAAKTAAPIGISLGSVALYRSKRRLITANGIDLIRSSPYRLKENKRPGRWFPIAEDEEGTMILRDALTSLPRDMVKEHLPFAWIFVWRGALDFASFQTFLRREREGCR